MNIAQLMNSMEQVEVCEILYRKEMTFGEYVDLSKTEGLELINFIGAHSVGREPGDNGVMLLDTNCNARWTAEIPKVSKVKDPFIDNLVYRNSEPFDKTEL